MNQFIIMENIYNRLQIMMELLYIM